MVYSALKASHTCRLMAKRNVESNYDYMDAIPNKKIKINERSDDGNLINRANVYNTM